MSGSFRDLPFAIHYLFLHPFSHIVECRSALGVYPIKARCNLTNKGLGADGNPLPCRYWPLIFANAVAFIASHLVAFGKHQRIFHVDWITCKHLAQAASTRRLLADASKINCHKKHNLRVSGNKAIFSIAIRAIIGSPYIGKTNSSFWPQGSGDLFSCTRRLVLEILSRIDGGRHMEPSQAVPFACHLS